jgi:cullin-4
VCSALLRGVRTERPKLPESFEEDTWKKLQMSVRAVHQQQPVDQSFEELYKAVEDLCIHKLGQNLYDKLAVECEQHIEIEIAKLVGLPDDAQLLLETVEAAWHTHCAQMSLIRSIFLYLDRTYVIQSANVCSLWAMGLQLFRKHLEAATELPPKIVAGVLALVQKERAGDMVKRQLMRNLLRMLWHLQIYSPLFETAFLEASKAFYLEEGHVKIAQLDVPSYLLHVERRLQEENERVGHYLDAQTRKPLVAVLDCTLLEVHVQDILDKGLETLIAQHRVSDLQRLYVLLGRVNGLSQIKTGFGALVRRVGTEIVMNEERSGEMVKDLLDLKSNMDVVLEQAFESNEELGHALKDAFEALINVRQNKPAEHVAKYIDAQLRSGGKGVSEQELEALLDRVLTLFRFIQGKDVFEAFFKKDLAKRLLLNKSASIDAEKSIISKLKQECGSGFTKKLEGMFKDMELSRDIAIAFAQSQSKKDLQAKIGSEISVHVLTTGYWPAYPPAPLNLPKELLDHQEAFEKFYLSKHQGRRLSWHNSLAHCSLKARIGLLPNGKADAPKELLVSLYQAAILLLFNDTESMPYSAIAHAVGMEDKELRVTLQSLACAKIRVLNKEPKGRDVDDTDVFHLNSKFDVKQLRIKINSIQLKETQEENDKTTESVFQDRQYQVDAAVVRVMKARKSLSHALLISELFKMLKFPVCVPLNPCGQPDISVDACA